MKTGIPRPTAGRPRPILYRYNRRRRILYLMVWYDARATASPRRRVLALTSGTTCPVVVFPASATTPRRPHRNGTYTTVPAAPRATKWYAARPRRPAGGRDIKMCPAPLRRPHPPDRFPLWRLWARYAVRSSGRRRQKQGRAPYYRGRYRVSLSRVSCSRATRPRSAPHLGFFSDRLKN